MHYDKAAVILHYSEAYHDDLNVEDKAEQHRTSLDLELMKHG